MTSTKQFYITHFVVEDPPVEGMRRLAFYTATFESRRENKYYSGFGLHKAYTLQNLEGMLKAQSVIPIPNPVEVDLNDGVWLDAEENVWIADRKNPYTDDGKKKVFSLKQSRLNSGEKEISRNSKILIETIRITIFSARISASSHPPQFRLVPVSNPTTVRGRSVPPKEKRRKLEHA